LNLIFDKKSLQGVNEKQVHYPKADEFLSFYAKSKALAEQLVLKANQKQIKTIALRPHLIWGKDDPHLFPSVVKARKEGRLKIIGKGDNIVDMTHVQNAVSAHLCALNSLQENPELCQGKAYFIADEEPVVLWPFINEVLQLHGEKPLAKDEKISLKMAYNLGTFFEGLYKLFRIYGKQPPMTRFVAMQLASSHYFDHEAAVNDLAYEPKTYLLR
jgi:nucleoside-diphosphate-sugar epimerase